jgi:hypothetical protein
MPYTKREYLSVSTLVEFDRCPRRYFYRKYGLQPPDDYPQLTYGTAMHKAVPVALETENLSEALKAFCSVWNPVVEENPEWATDPTHNIFAAQKSLKHFIFSRGSGKCLYKLIRPPEGSLVSEESESEFECPWTVDVELPVPLAGRFDSFCRHRDTNKLWIYEFKTTSRLTSSFFDAHEMSPQNLVYTLIGQTLQGEPVEGVMVEGMLKHKTKVENMTQPIPVQDHHLYDALEWIQRTGQRLLDMEAKMEDLHDATPFYKNFCGCTPYIHYYMSGYRCEYADLCRVPDWATLKSLYREVPDHDFLKTNTNVPTKRIITSLPMFPSAGSSD